MTVEHVETAQQKLWRKKAKLLDEVGEAFPPSELRELAGSMLRLADAVDQDWNPNNVQSVFHWPSSAARIERNAHNLSARAAKILKARRERSGFLPDELMGEPAFEMLLELFCQFAGGAAVSTTSLAIGSGAPQSTAMRYIALLEEHGLIERYGSKSDARVMLVSLSKAGVLAVGRMLERQSS